jgi:capsular exopolysaccharide synthesis family protein
MIIDEARSTNVPIKPKKDIIFIIGLLVGLGLPSLYLILLLTLDSRIKNLDDLRKATPIPLIGTIPHHGEVKQLVLEGNSNSPIAEAFRSVRTNLAFLVRKDAEKAKDLGSVIQLTSTMGSEGKSFCSINLASSLAMGGLKTIVVGLDLRKPKLAEYFNVSNKIGASSVLAGLETLDKAVMNSGLGNMDILVAGPIPPNPSELLMSKALEEMIQELRKAYEYVIIDCPPIGLVTDSLIVSDHADTTIYITRQNVTNSTGLSYINDLYLSKKIKSVSILFNDVKVSRFGYGYGYGYGYYAETTSLTLLQRMKRRMEK